MAGAEEEDEVRHFLICAEAAGGGGFDDGFEHFGCAELLVEIVVDGAWGDGIDADAFGGEFLGPAFGDGGDGGFGGGVGGGSGASSVAGGDGADVDDDAGAAADHGGDAGLGKEPHRFRVEGEDGIEGGFGHFAEFGAADEGAGVIDEDVEFEAGGVEGAEEIPDAIHFGEVGLDGGSGGAEGADMGEGGFGAFGEGVVLEDDGGAAGAGEGDGGGGSDAPAGSGDEGGFAGEFVHWEIITPRVRS